MHLKTYWSIWYRSSLLSLETVLATWLASLGYISGKWIRFGFTWWFIHRLGSTLPIIGGYTQAQLLIFFLVFSTFDMLGQILFRGVYWFRQDVISGQFDLTLLKPVNAIFFVLARRTDLLDIPLLGLVIFYLVKLGMAMDLNWVLFGAMALLSIITIAAIHITAAGIGVLTLEVEHALWIYRDTVLIARFPSYIYPSVIQWLLMTILPVGIIMTIPAQALVGLLTGTQLLLTLVISVVWLGGSLKLWQYALRFYTSASS